MRRYVLITPLTQNHSSSAVLYTYSLMVSSRSSTVAPSAVIQRFVSMVIIFKVTITNIMDGQSRTDLSTVSGRSHTFGSSVPGALPPCLHAKPIVRTSLSRRGLSSHSRSTHRPLSWSAGQRMQGPSCSSFLCPAGPPLRAARCNTSHHQQNSSGSTLPVHYSLVAF